MNFDQLTDVLRELIRQPAVVGAEHAFFRVLQRLLEERGAEVTWYEGLLVAQGNQPESTMLSAHIDRHGLICTGPNEFQYAAFVAGNRSDLLGNSVSEQMMNRISGRFASQPVVAYEPWSGAYCGTGVINNAYICEHRNNLIFEIEQLEHLIAGTPVAFGDRLRVENDRFVGQLDNVLTAAMLVHLFDLGFRGTAFFTAEEEAGKSWRYLLEWFRRFGGSANELIVVDTSPYPTAEAADAQQVVLRYRDANSQFNTLMSDRIAEICELKNIPYSFKDVYIQQRNEQAQTSGQPAVSIGSTELGRITVASGGLVYGTTMQIPTTGYHTTEESAAINACESFLRVLMRVAKLPGED